MILFKFPGTRTGDGEAQGTLENPHPQKALKTFLDFKKENEVALNKTLETRKKRNKLYEELNKIKKEIDKLKSQKEVVKPEIENMKKIVDSLKKDKKKLSQQI